MAAISDGGGGVSHGFISGTGRQSSGHHKAKANSQVKCSVIHLAWTQKSEERLWTEEVGVETVRHRWETPGWFDRCEQEQTRPTTKWSDIWKRTCEPLSALPKCKLLINAYTHITDAAFLFFFLNWSWKSDSLFHLVTAHQGWSGARRGSGRCLASSLAAALQFCTTLNKYSF